MGVYKFGNNTYPQRIRRRLNLGHIFRGKKSASYGPGNTVLFLDFFITTNKCTIISHKNTYHNSLYV